jgi:hypothetical protein
MPQANINAPFGLKPLKSPSGIQRVNSYAAYTIANAYNTAIPYQSVVSKSGSGTDLIAGANSTAAKVGVFLGCRYQDSLGNFIFSKNWLASTATLNSVGAQAIVADDPKQIFLARMSLALVAADVGQFAGMVVGAADGNGVSTSAVDSADITGTADVFKILELYNDGQNAYGNYSLVKVMLGIHEYNAPAAS